MRIYVAGAWVEKEERARPAMVKLRAAGHEITYDWIPSLERCAELEAAGINSDAGLSGADRLRFAVADRDGVLTADLLWVLCSNTQAGAGHWVELGIAIGARCRRHELGGFLPRIVVSGAKRNRTIFTALADCSMEHDEDALQWICAP